VTYRPPDTLGMRLGCLASVLVALTAMLYAVVSAMGCEIREGPCPADDVPFWLILPTAIAASLLVRWLVGQIRR